KMRDIIEDVPLIEFRVRSAEDGAGHERPTSKHFGVIWLVFQGNAWRRKQTYSVKVRSHLLYAPGPVGVSLDSTQTDGRNGCRGSGQRKELRELVDFLQGFARFCKRALRQQGKKRVAAQAISHRIR